MPETTSRATVTINNPQGLHMRPAYMFAETASQFESRIEVAKLDVMAKDATWKTEQQKLNRNITTLQAQLDHQRSLVDYLPTDFLPLVEEQRKLSLAAYREGEAGYLEYLDSLEQVVEVKQQYLKSLFKFNVLNVELNYWTEE